MREIIELQLLRKKIHRGFVLAGRILFAACFSFAVGCGVKRTVRIDVPPDARIDRTATFEDLLDIIRNYEGIDSLSSNGLNVTLTTGGKESGQLEEYRSAPGYILLKRPDSIRLVVQTPVTKTSILTLNSAGDNFDVWMPRDNRYLIGKNSAKRLFYSSSSGTTEITFRAAHIFEAIFPQSILLDTPGYFVSMEEAADEKARYYILAFYREGTAARIHTVRKIWIERSGLTIARQQVYQESGQIIGDIVYSNGIRMNGFSLPDSIHIDRPLDAYSLDIEFKSWRINPNLPDNAFVLTPPSGAQIIHLEEKEESTMK